MPRRSESSGGVITMIELSWLQVFVVVLGSILLGFLIRGDIS